MAFSLRAGNRSPRTVEQYVDESMSQFVRWLAAKEPELEPREVRREHVERYVPRSVRRGPRLLRQRARHLRSGRGDTAARNGHPVLRHGRQRLRPISLLDRPFSAPAAGEIIAWSRILDDEEALCAVDGHGNEARGDDVIVDTVLNPPARR